MPDFKALESRIAAGEVIILDGAMGTEIQRVGVPMHDFAWSAAALKTHADTVRQLHEDYLRAGAEILITNSFSTARYVLEASGMGDDVRALTMRSVELAKEARDNVPSSRPVYVAGALSVYGVARHSPTDAALGDSYKEQASLLAEAGVDFIFLEMLDGKFRWIQLAMEGALDTGLPIWVALSAHKRAGNGENMGLDDDDEMPYGDLVGQTMAMGGSLFAVIHSEVEDTEPALDAAKTAWSGPLGAYPHSGYWIRPNWQYVNMISPENFLREAQGWVEDGVQLVGGCCGIGIQHVELLREGLPASIPQIR